MSVPPALSVAANLPRLRAAHGPAAACIHRWSVNGSGRGLEHSDSPSAPPAVKMPATCPDTGVLGVRIRWVISHAAQLP